MEIKGKIEVSKEEVLMQFKPEELLEYVKKNYPTVFKSNVPEPNRLFRIGQWFMDGDGFYCLVYIPNRAYLMSVNPKTGYLCRKNDKEIPVIDGKYLIKDELLQPISYSEYFNVSSRR